MDEKILIATKTALIAYAAVIIISLLVAALIKVIAIILGGKQPVKKPTA